MKFTIAIDGPAAAGKGTISRAVAEHFNMAYLDTGLLYRVVGAKVLAGETPVDAAKTIHLGELNGAYLRSPEVAQAASRAAVLSDVRMALTEFQRDFARREGGAVLDGRDIGTVICPQADVKLFITATPGIRAMRRLKELDQQRSDLSYSKVLNDVNDRDKRDRERKMAPLIAAEDAITIDTSSLNSAAAISHVIEIIQKRMDL
jgi:cytidylate kinase